MLNLVESGVFSRNEGAKFFSWQNNEARNNVCKTNINQIFSLISKIGLGDFFILKKALS
jgi:hypothetical protein